MNRFLSRRRMRNTAFMVLLAWLFAIASGVANACLLEAPHHELHALAAASHAADFSTRSSRLPCQKVCDDAPQSLPKAVSGIDQTNPGLPPPSAILWSATAPIAVGTRRSARMQPALPELPIRLRYARLAL